MFKRRKNPAPYFRQPNPSNPIIGSKEYLYPPLKQYARFKLTEALTTTDESKKAEITDAGQWGPNPIYHCSDIIIHVVNQLADDDTTYLFSGSIGDVGIALWDRDNVWRIITLGKPAGTVGGCLDEAHPGRGVAFNIHLGVWSSSLDKWEYAAVATVKAIDWRYGVPYPTAGATGLFEARKSDTHGTIYETISMDCESPGACGD